MSKKYVVAVIGATGNVGRQVLNYLSEREFPIQDIVAVASDRSVGKHVSFGDKNLSILKMTDLDFAKIDLAFFCAGSHISKEYARIAADKGCIVIDKSSYFRLDKDIPLIVPEANIQDLKGFKGKGGIIANPNCCTIPLATVLKPLNNEAKIKRVIISTYQSVSGAGKLAMDELYIQTKAKYVFENTTPRIFQNQIAFNLFPHIGDFRKDGSTDEEYKIQQELKRIIDVDMGVSVTCVRVPVFVSHSMSVNIEFAEELPIEEIAEILSEADSIIVNRDENEHQYATPVDAVENDDVFVSRIRKDDSCKNAINLWVVCDNLRKGAALNAVQIAEEIIKIN